MGGLRTAGGFFFWGLLLLLAEDDEGCEMALIPPDRVNCLMDTTNARCCGTQAEAQSETCNHSVAASNNKEVGQIQILIVVQRIKINNQTRERGWSATFSGFAGSDSESDASGEEDGDDGDDEDPPVQRLQLA